MDAVDVPFGAISVYDAVALESFAFLALGSSDILQRIFFIDGFNTAIWHENGLVVVV